MTRPKQVKALEVLTLSDLVDRVADRSPYTKNNVHTVLKLLREVVVEEIAKGNAVRWYRFGTFVPVVRYKKDKTTNIFKLDKSTVGLVFYPSSAITSLKPQVDVDLLLERGEYDGRSHVYTKKRRR